MNTLNNRLTILGASVYTILFVLISLYVFIENDETKPLIEIFQLNFLIPVLFYSSGAIWVSLGLFLLLKKILNRYISSPVSLIIGIPIGLLMIEKLFYLLSDILPRFLRLLV